MNELKVKLEIFKDRLPDYRELYNFFSSHEYTRFSRSKFTGYVMCLFDVNPFGKGIQVVARDNSGEMIGYIGLLSVPFSHNNISISGAQMVNLLVHSKFQGRGLFLKLLAQLLNNAEKSDFEFIYGFPNPTSHHGFKKTGWNEKDLSYWKTRLDETSEFNIINKYVRIKNFEKIDQSEINKVEYNNELFQINKNLEYLTWRFVELGRFFEYEIFKILDDSENCLGLVVLNKYKKKQITHGQIIDAVIPLDSFDIYGDLLNFYCEYYKDKKIFNLQFFLYSPLTIQNYLISRDFSPCSKNRFFIYRSNNPDFLDSIKFNRFLLYLSSKDNL